MAEEKEKRETGYAFNYIADFGAGQQLQITGSFPKDVTEKEISVEVKKFRNVIEKNRTQSGLRDLQDRVNGFEKTIFNLQETLAEMDERNKGRQIPSSEKNAREQTLTGIAHNMRELEQARKLLAEKKAEIED
jgi:predicted RNase H-like nuclease (RuvC/YqgF family)